METYEVLHIEKIGENKTYYINYFEDSEFKCVPERLRLNEDEFIEFKVGKREV